VLEKNGEVIFLRKLKEGPSAESYGLHVAALAGLPETVLERARELLVKLRTGETSLRKILPAMPGGETAAGIAGAAAGPASPKTGIGTGLKSPDSGPLVSKVPAANRLFRELEALNPDGITPLEALETLYRLKKLSEAGPEYTGQEPPARKPAEMKIRNSGPSLFEGL
jgi:DNA mismatch repair protein MutS